MQKKKRVYNQLVDLLNVLLCMYISYGCYSKIDKMIHIKIVILEEQAKLGELPYIVKNKWGINDEWQNVSLPEHPDDNIIQEISQKNDVEYFSKEENYISEHEDYDIQWSDIKTAPFLQNNSCDARKKIFEDNLSTHLCVFSFFKKMKKYKNSVLPDFLVKNLNIAYKKTYPHVVS